MFLLPYWVILSILAGLGSNTFNFFSRYMLKGKDDPTAYAWYFETLRFIIFAAIAIVDWKLVVTPKSLIIFVLLGITEMLSIYWYMKMHSYSHLSISSILSRTRLIWVPLIAFFLVGESLTLFEYIGIAILFGGLSIVIVPKKLFIDKGAIYANLAAFMIALNIVLTKMALPYASNSVINAAITLPSVFLFPLLMKQTRERVGTLFRTNILLKSGAILINVASVYLFTIALRFGDSSKVTAIYQGMLIFSVLAGIIFLKERDNIIRKLLGTGVALIGVICLSLT